MFGCTASKVRDVVLKVSSGQIEMVKNKNFDTKIVEAPYGFTIQAVMDNGGNPVFSNVATKCNFKVSGTPANGLWTFTKCTQCYGCLNALGFKCGVDTLSLRVAARAGGSYLASEWSVPMPFVPVCTAPAGQDCLN